MAALPQVSAPPRVFLTGREGGLAGCWRAVLPSCVIASKRLDHQDLGHIKVFGKMEKKD